MSNITKLQKDILFAIWQECDSKDKSTEYMLNYMADTSGIPYDDVVDFISNTTFEERKNWNKKSINKPKKIRESDIIEMYYKTNTIAYRNKNRFSGVFTRWLIKQLIKELNKNE